MIPLIGYVNKLSARPGDTLEFKVSSTFNVPFQASLVRIRCSDPNPAGPGIREKSVDASFTGQYPSRIQNIKSAQHLTFHFKQALFAFAALIPTRQDRAFVRKALMHLSLANIHHASRIFTLVLMGLLILPDPLKT